MRRTFILALTGILLFTGMPVLGSPYTMKGPPRHSAALRTDQEQSASVAGNALLGAIGLYRRFISPTQAARCGFYPSCSTFGMQAVQQYGPLKGGMMTADRLTRCNHFKQPGPDYYLRPDGRLYDPVQANLLLQR